MRISRLRPSLVLALLIGGAPETASPQEMPAAPTDAEWRADIRFVTNHLIANHVAPFHSTSEADFRSGTAELISSVGKASDAELVVGLSRLVASIGDAHTYLRFPAEGPLAFRPYPVRFDWAADGLIIGSAVSRYARLVGARVESLDGTPAESAFRVASAYLYRENPITARIAAPKVLSLAEAAAAIGVAASADSLALALRLPGGERETVTVRPLAATPDDWTEPHEARGLPAPLHVRNRERNFWLEPLDDRNAWYVQFNSARDSEEETIAAFAARLGDSLVARPAGDVVLDVRWNVGGNSAATVPLVRMLVAQRERAPDSRFFIVIGRWSLSATIVMLGDLTRLLDPVLVGEPTGARPNLYGENPFSARTPHGGLEFTWATQYFQPFGPGPQPEAVLPHVAAEPTAADLLAGRDPALQAIADYAPHNLAAELHAAYADGGIEAAVAAYEVYRADPRYRWRRPFDLVRRFGNEIGASHPEDALAVFRLLQRDYPDRARTYELLGSVFEDLGLPGEARDNYREALRRLSEDPTVSRPLAYALGRWIEERLAGLE